MKFSILSGYNDYLVLITNVNQYFGYLVNILEIESGIKPVGKIRDHIHFGKGKLNGHYDNFYLHDRQLVLDHKDWIDGHMLMVIG
ncbi:hypothetical protein DERF_002983 [Dermatophagoides farinae]|uniref:Uncharacterized protein n=1 Tax=Dermatophagoides farinae TaxID=6954 RepID=A0A922LB17_DERFA|nr:hypothetical protein DERF_002983 [Dermatophagoides farinae]